MVDTLSNPGSAKEHSERVSMTVRVLGCSGGQVPGHNLSSYLMNDSLLIDAGSTTSVLDLEEQAKIENILITHAHLDHAGSLATLSDNMFDQRADSIIVWGIRETISALTLSFFNNVIWPDFTRLTSRDRPHPVIVLRELQEERPETIGDFTITAVAVAHSVPGVAYFIERRGTTLLHVGDTGPTERVWQMARMVENLSALTLEASFPNRLKEIAARSGHLTPETLAGELAKLDRPDVPVYVTHLKPAYRDEIIAELKEVRGYSLTLMNDGDVIRF